jgi:hypothetical protein
MGDFAAGKGKAHGTAKAAADVAGGQHQAIGRNDDAATAAMAHFQGHDGRRDTANQRLNVLLDCLEVSDGRWSRFAEGGWPFVAVSRRWLRRCRRKVE